MNHLDLFSGIGTWALASQEVWPDREMVGFAEIDPFACAILLKHFPEVKNYGNIVALADALCGVEQEQQGGGSASRVGSQEPRDCAGTGTGDRTGDGDSAQGVRGLESSSDKLSKTGYADTNSLGHGLQEPWPQLEADRDRQLHQNLYDLDLLTASPPCQAASTAGKRKGTDDARWLWPATLRIVDALRPRYFILENVAGLLSLNGGVEFDKVLAELETKGYEVQPFLVPAAAVGAPHKRDRVWIVGRRNSHDQGLERHRQYGERARERIAGTTGGESVADTPNQRKERPRSSRPRGSRLANRSEWNQDWRTVADRTCREIQVESGVRRIYDGTTPWIPFFLGRLNYASTYSALDGQDLSALWKKVQSSEIQWTTGGCWEIPPKSCLLQILRWFQRKWELQQDLSKKDGEDIPEKELRAMREFIETRRSSQERKNLGKYTKELEDALPFLPHEIALEVTEIWDSIQILSSKFPRTKVINLPDGTVISASKWRQEALKAIGNGIVGHVAVELMRAIKATESAGGKLLRNS